MKNRKKYNLFEIISYVLFVLVAISSILVSSIYAKYTSKDNNTSGSNVASFDINVDIVDSTTLTQIIEYEMYPGSTILLDVNIDAQDSDVKVKYKITISTLGNLPLEITHSGVNIDTSEITGEINIREQIKLNDIQIQWVESIENNNYKYSGEVDLIIVNVEVEQVE